MNRPHFLAIVLLASSPWLASAEEIARLPDTEPLTEKGELGVRLLL